MSGDVQVRFCERLGGRLPGATRLIIGVHGSKKDCQDIKEKLGVFLRDTLKLELSEEKTLITNSSDKARFLNYEVKVRENYKIFENKDGEKARSGNRCIALFMPRDTMRNHIIKKKIVKDIDAKQWQAKARDDLQNLSDLEIVEIYNAEIRGLYRYYGLAENVSNRMDTIYYMMEYSCLKTLAGKHKTSLKKMRKKLRDGKGWGARYDTKTKKNQTRFFYDEGFAMMKVPYRDPRTKKIDPKIDSKPNAAIYMGTTELESRMAAERCERCGKENVDFHIHHVRSVKDLKDKDEFEKLHIAKRRKTLVLCKECHAMSTAQQATASNKSRAKLTAKAKEQSRRAKASLVGTV